MRIIKFRAWDVERKCWIYTEIKSADDLWDDRYYGRSLEHLNQFTGLLDKNGKEIYEGDIYTEGYECQDGSHKYGDRNVVEDIRTFRPQDEVEVIGNIYENPELINNETKI